MLLAGRAMGQEGDVYHVHDPAIIEQDGHYYVFGTGVGIPFWTSDDLYHWRRAGRVFDGVAEWARQRVPRARDHWAARHLVFSAASIASTTPCPSSAHSVP